MPDSPPTPSVPAGRAAAPPGPVTVVAGNPKPASRTLDAGIRLARALTSAEPDAVVDVVTLGPGLLGWGDEGVARAVATVAGSRLVVVASPTYKATYTGVLKLFCDQFAGGTGMAGVTAVPLMLGGGPAHALAPQVHLAPLLAELGAAVPAPALYLHDATYAEDGRLEEYAATWGGVLRASAAATATAGQRA